MGTPIFVGSQSEVWVVSDVTESCLWVCANSWLLEPELNSSTPVGFRREYPQEDRF